MAKHSPLYALIQLEHPGPPKLSCGLHRNTTNQTKGFSFPAPELTNTNWQKKKKRLVQRAGGLKKDGRLRSVCEGRPAFPPRHRLCIQTTFQLHAPAEMQSHGGGDARQKAAELKRQLKPNMFFLKVRFLHCRGES